GIPSRRGPTSRLTIAPRPGNLPVLLAPLTPMSLVVSIRCPAAKWSPVLWCSDRTMENLSVTLACLGYSSVTSKPGTFVLMGFQRPRYSAGASGFMSYMSMWPGPPSNQIRMTDVFLVAEPEASLARRTWARLADPIPATPAWTKLRRDIPSQYRSETP